MSVPVSPLRSSALLGVLLALSSCAPGAPSGALGFEWPPVVEHEYPDLTLLDAHGATVHLSDFRGKVLLIEPIGMT